LPYENNEGKRRSLCILLRCIYGFRIKYGPGLNTIRCLQPIDSHDSLNRNALANNGQVNVDILAKRWQGERELQKAPTLELCYCGANNKDYRGSLRSSMALMACFPYNDCIKVLYNTIEQTPCSVMTPGMSRVIEQGHKTCDI